MKRFIATSLFLITFLASNATAEKIDYTVLDTNPTEGQIAGGPSPFFHRNFSVLYDGVIPPNGTSFSDYHPYDDTHVLTVQDIWGSGGYGLLIDLGDLYWIDEIRASHRAYDMRFYYWDDDNSNNASPWIIDPDGWLWTTNPGLNANVTPGYFYESSYSGHPGYTQDLFNQEFPAKLIYLSFWALDNYSSIDRVSIAELEFIGTKVNPVPEPATMILVGSGLIGLAGYKRRKFRKK